jgi:hypothetical protein
MATVDHTLEHLETSIGTVQGVLDHAQRVVDGLETAHERVDWTVTVLRQGAAVLVIGTLLIGAFALVRARRR